jgi:hypothetical protein
MLQLLAIVVVSSLVELIVPLAASLSTGPNVCPASVDTLSTGSRVILVEDTKNSSSRYL